MTDEEKTIDERLAEARRAVDDVYAESEHLRVDPKQVAIFSQAALEKVLAVVEAMVDDGGEVRS